ncbi:MAG: acyl-CoA dehydrogenase domain-containing protein, partial [Burkholderiales bacterium]
AMYLASATLKRYEDQGRMREDLPLLEYSVQDALYQAQQALDAIIANFPSRLAALKLRAAVFPLGKRFAPPSDRLNHQCAQLLLAPGDARDRLTAGMYLARSEADPIGKLEAALVATIACEPIGRKLHVAVRRGTIAPRAGADAAALGRDRGVISGEEYALWQKKEALRKEVIKVDDFEQDFARAAIMQKLAQEQVPAAKAA